MAHGKRVLLLYITERSGHHGAALAIKKALEIEDSSTPIMCVNAFRYAFPFAERFIHAVYLTVIKRVPRIWESMYDNPRLVGKSLKVKGWVHGLGITRLKGLVEHFKPNTIVCTQAFPCGIVADYKRIHKANVRLLAVLTDFAPHSFWVYDEVDAYVVPCQESRTLLIQKGVPETKIKILGIPIDPKFSKNLDRSELLANFGLKDGVPVVMIMGGGHGLGPIKDLLRRLDAGDAELQIIVVCGLNIPLYRWIQRRRFRNRILNFKYTDQIDRLMSLSSLIITKPGGITTAEALAKKLPMIILNPIPGQEARNTQILIKNKAAIKTDSPADCLAAIEQILVSARPHTGLSRPNSSMDIARLILW